ncbi:S8 family serine peptidase [Luteolibacter sp. GHJ8]|uniref:S8 family serine peptidase n=1 Tax=Luteolibacter rhizosphaerae TaxID=2989719 RepID=A0ABT3G679_9BACT|nr:S8 family serine peptidase [Luteolibacter rhizosphaerae]MCW1915318.1 S8 family serine peptidase [Luteolibacter rhizosphaerae]
MTPRLRRFLPAILVLLLGLTAFWFARSTVALPRVAGPAKAKPGLPPLPKEEVRLPVERATVSPAQEELEIEIYSSYREGELVMRLPSLESYTEFLEAARQHEVEITERADRLRALRVAWKTDEDKAKWTEVIGDRSLSVNKGIATTAPIPKAGGGIGKREALSFGDQLLPWLGVSGDNSRWGYGVKVAVLDSGIIPHPGLPSISRSVEILPFGPDPSATFFHGTAVASLIAGHSRMARGIAPAVELISIRVIDDAGKSDALSISSGLLAALDHGAEIINLSLGCPEDLPIIRDAIRMVIDAGIVVVASSGNEGLREPRYPAAYDGVIAVGAIEAGAERMAFSNLGSSLGITAPGYGVNAAEPGGGYISFGGTSASAPIVCGAIAATMADGSGHRIPAPEAARIVLANADDEGAAGADTEYGSGVLNLDRVMNRGQRGRYDAAIISQTLLPDDGGILVSIQNRGTEILVNSLLEVSTPAGTTKINATTIAPGAVQSFTVPYRQNLPGFPVQIRSKVSLGGNAVDLTPENNVRDGNVAGI